MSSNKSKTSITPIPLPSTVPPSILNVPGSHFSLASVCRQPVLIWLLLAFLVTFVVFFIRPVFLNYSYTISLYPDFPSMNPIGADLREYLGFSRAVFTQGTPYIGQNYYPPFEAVFFMPIMNMPITRAYNWITVVNYALFVMITLGFPLLAGRKRQISSILTLMLVSGLFSYGFLFQLERGQYDLIVMFLCFGGLLLFHQQPRWRWLAYILMTVSIQIKIYPAIFLICLVSDWKDWKHNLRRWGLLFLVNFAGLFILGPKVFMDFVQRLMSQMNHPTFVTIVNHSINSFVTVTVKDNLPGLAQSAGLIQAALLALFGLFFLLILFQVYRRRLSGLNPYLILACTIGTMLIPSTSHDYKLVILIAPLAFLLNSIDMHAPGARWQQAGQVGLVFLISLAYCSTLYVGAQKPLLFRSNFPPLMVILMAAACLMFLRARLLDQSRVEQPFSDLV